MDQWRGATCYVEQGQYGHAARKGTWLYAVGVTLPDLDWTLGAQRLDPVMVERHGYEYARRKGLVSMVGGKRKTEIRNATPPQFRDLLLSIAGSAGPRRINATHSGRRYAEVHEHDDGEIYGTSHTGYIQRGKGKISFDQMKERMLPTRKDAV
jgi:hypothetical protein